MAPDATRCSKRRRAISVAETLISAALIFRFVFDKVDELDRFVPRAKQEYPGFHAGVPEYPRTVFREDLMRVTEGKSDPALADLLIDASYDTTCWLQDVGKHEFELARSVMGIKVGNVSLRSHAQ